MDKGIRISFTRKSDNINENYIIEIEYCFIDRNKVNIARNSVALRYFNSIIQELVSDAGKSKEKIDHKTMQLPIKEGSFIETIQLIFNNIDQMNGIFSVIKNCVELAIDFMGLNNHIDIIDTLNDICSLVADGRNFCQLADEIYRSYRHFGHHIVRAEKVIRNRNVVLFSARALLKSASAISHIFRVYCVGKI